MRRSLLALLSAAAAALLAASCASREGAAPSPTPVPSPSSTGTPPPGCAQLDGITTLPIAVAPSAGEYALTLPVTTASHTSWAAAGNEALILEVNGASGLIGHLVLHQGADGFDYAMAVGTLSSGETLSVNFSTLSASAATLSACVGPATLTPASAFPAAGEGLAHAPILKWPVKKRFDDLPLVVGWSQAKRHYEVFYTNENGGTTKQCGGGADGMQAEIARWGRGFDVEGAFTYDLATPSASTWERCTGTIPFSTTAPRMEGLHPILYYGDGHNRLFESRGGYGQACGTGAPEMADGDLTGFNVQNPGNDPSNDPLFTITLRPVPVEMDPLGFPSAGGRREGVPDHYAPWLYRLTDGEIKREGKVDETKTLTMERYLFMDVHAADVGGNGDGVCTLTVSGGFVMRARTTDGATLSGPRMTADYFGGQVAWKRIAVPLDRLRAASEIGQLVFDAYDNDGIYFLDEGAAFMPRPAGENGASLEYVEQNGLPENVYVDDDNSSCSGGVNTGGPQAGFAYPCKGSFFVFSP